MKLLRELNETFKNSYSVGDKVKTPFGVGKIIDQIQSTSKDVYFSVEVDGKKYKIGSFQLQGHITETVEVLWEGELDGKQYQFIIQEGFGGFAKKGGILRGMAKGALKFISNPIVAGMAAGYAVDAFAKYKRNKRTTTTFFAKDMQEKNLYKGIVADLMKTGHYVMKKQKYESGGYLWVLQRKGTY